MSSNRPLLKQPKPLNFVQRLVPGAVERHAKEVEAFKKQQEASAAALLDAKANNPVANGERIVRIVNVSVGTPNAAKDALVPPPVADLEDAAELPAPLELPPVIAGALAVAPSHVITPVASPRKAGPSIVVKVEPLDESLTEEADVALADAAEADDLSAVSVVSVKAKSESSSSSSLSSSGSYVTESATSKKSDASKSAVKKTVTINSNENIVHDITPVASVPRKILDLNPSMDDNDFESALDSSEMISEEEPTSSMKKYLPVILAVTAAVVVIGLIAAALFVPGVAPLLGITVATGASSSLFFAFAGFMAKALTATAAALGISEVTAGLVAAAAICAVATAVVTASISAFVQFVAKKVFSTKMQDVQDIQYNSSSFDTPTNSSKSSTHSTFAALASANTSKNDSQAPEASASAPVLETASQPPAVVTTLASEVERRETASEGDSREDRVSFRA